LFLDSKPNWSFIELMVEENIIHVHRIFSTVNPRSKTESCVSFKYIEGKEGLLLQNASLNLRVVGPGFCRPDN
jgi:hypothetical protein